MLRRQCYEDKNFDGQDFRCNRDCCNILSFCYNINVIHINTLCIYCNNKMLVMRLLLIGLCAFIMGYIVGLICVKMIEK